MRRAWLMAFAFSLTAHAAAVVVCLHTLIIPARVEVAAGDQGGEHFRVRLVEMAPAPEPPREELAVEPDPPVEPEPAPETAPGPDPPNEHVAFEIPPEPQPEPTVTEKPVEKVAVGRETSVESASAKATALAGAQAEPLSQRNRPPAYPVIARRQGWEGTVVLEVEVRADGRVSRVAVACSSDYEALDRAAADAVQRWLFKPATRLGGPVASVVRLPVRFELVAR